MTFEGTEGAGKSTLIRTLAEILRQKNQSVTVTREPGGDPLAEKLRTLILENSMDPRTELFLYEAARAEHLARTVLPALKRGEIVLCDRFTDSSLAYQAHARGLPWKDVCQANQLATQGLIPHLTVWLDIDPEQGLRRAQDPNRFEAEGVAFQKKVRAGFLKASREIKPKRWLRLKARTESPEELAQAVLKKLTVILASKNSNSAPQKRAYRKRASR